MKKLQRQKGFTLVELAIVLTIVGLLIGGILKGQQLMTNARVTATMAQVQAIDAAVTTFRDTYNFLPGDLPTPDQRLPNFVATVTTASDANIGNGLVGTPWNLASAAANAYSTNSPFNDATETIMFFPELSAGGLISGVTYEGGAAAIPTPAFGTTQPTARIAGGWIIGNADGASAQPGSVAPTATNGVQRVAGLALAISAATSNVLNTAPTLITPSVAAQIDRKQDDGLALSGFIQGYGASAATTGCLLNTATPPTYVESNASKVCGLLWRIQG